MPSLLRLTALIMPMEAELLRPKGLPTANTMSPGAGGVLSAKRDGGQLSAGGNA